MTRISFAMALLLLAACAGPYHGPRTVRVVNYSDKDGIVVGNAYTVLPDDILARRPPPPLQQGCKNTRNTLRSWSDPRPPQSIAARRFSKSAILSKRQLHGGACREV